MPRSLERQDVEAVGRPWHCGKKIANRNGLKRRHDAIGAGSSGSMSLDDEGASQRPPSFGCLQALYQWTRTPTRSTRGARTELMLLAVAAFCVRCSAWIVFEFITLNTSIDGMNRMVPSLTGRSTCTSRFWKLGRRFSPTLSRRTVAMPAPLARDGLWIDGSNG